MFNTKNILNIINLFYLNNSIFILLYFGIEFACLFLMFKLYMKSFSLQKVQKVLKL